MAICSWAILSFLHFRRAFYPYSPSTGLRLAVSDPPVNLLKRKILRPHLKSMRSETLRVGSIYLCLTSSPSTVVWGPLLYNLIGKKFSITFRSSGLVGLHLLPP